MHRSRLTALAAIRALGGFALARRLTARRLRILCYHGFSLRDEHEFRPGLFITPATLDRRLAYLRRAGHPVLPLGEALDRLRDGTLPPAAVAITIDDGFHGTLAEALPLFRKHGTPATLYLTTYYVRHQEPIYNLTLAYVLWRCAREEIDLRPLDVPKLATVLPWARLSDAERGDVAATLVRHGNHQLDRAGRRALLQRLAEATGVPLEPIEQERLFGLVNDEEARALQAGGVDIELHTHRHWSPGEEALAARELQDNLADVVRITGRRPRHFCFPSGRYDRWQDAWLEREGIRSGTTCSAGFADADTPPYRLGRFLDGENIPQLVFEAEMAGVFEVARQLRTRLAGPQAEWFAEDPGEDRPRAVPATA